MEKQHYIVLIISLVILVLGLFCQLYSSSFQFDTSTISIPKNGKIEKKELITVPLKARIWQIMAVALNTLAISIFISAFIVSRLEKGQKEAMNREVFAAVFKRLIPDDVFNAIKKDILSAKIVSEDGLLELNFNVSSSDVINFEQVLNYTAKNITAGKVTEHFESTLTSTPNTKNLVLQRTKWNVGGKNVVDYDLNDTTKRIGVKIEPIENQKKLIYDVEIPSFGIATATIVISCQYEDKVVDGFFSNRPFCNLTIAANFPEGYDFMLVPACSGNIEMIDRGQSSKRFKITGAILPKQGVLFFLKKADSSDPQQEDGYVSSESLSDIPDEELSS